MCQEGRVFQTFDEAWMSLFLRSERRRRYTESLRESGPLERKCLR